MTELYVPLSFEKKLLRYQTPSFSLTIDTIFCHIVPLTPGGHDKRCPLIFLGYPMIQFHEPKKREWFTIVIPWFFHSWSHYFVPWWSHILKCLSHDSMVKFLDSMTNPNFSMFNWKKNTFPFFHGFFTTFFVMFGMIFPNSEDDGLETRVPTTRPSPRQARTECLGQRSVSWRSSQRWQYP